MDHYNVHLYYRFISTMLSSKHINDKNNVLEYTLAYILYILIRVRIFSILHISIENNLFSFMGAKNVNDSSNIEFAGKSFFLPICEYFRE